MQMPRTATAWIAIVTAAFWLVTYIIGAEESAAIGLGFIPDRWSGAVMLQPAMPAFLTPLTATLVHGGVIHLGFNLLILVWCGLAVERVLGPKLLIFIYVVSAYAAAVAQWAVEPNAAAPMIGASGAIGGVVGAFALSFGQQKRIVASARLNRMLNALWLLAAWVVLQLMTAMLAGMGGVLIATPAHIGGFVAGLLMQRPLLMWRYRSA